MITKTRSPSRAAAAEAPAPLEAHLGFWLRFVSNHVSSRFQQLVLAEGVTVTEWVALRTLWARTETRHADLIEALGMTKGAASKVVTRLEEKGLAQRQFSEGNARDQALTLTRAGRLIPTLIEWDQDVPPLSQLLDEVDRARAVAAQALGPATSSASAPRGRHAT